MCRELQNLPNMYDKNREINMKSQFAAFLEKFVFFSMAIFITWGKKTLKVKTKAVKLQIGFYIEQWARLYFTDFRVYGQLQRHSCWFKSSTPLTHAKKKMFLHSKTHAKIYLDPKSVKLLNPVLYLGLTP